ncbi:MAG: hypothetical protein QMD05_08610 [Candidatus Brocadiaceae bacterium]|nr:hypothetical protein [Candidatus Brocadiaceae bacterium]
MTMSLTATERETCINFNAEEGTASIYTSQSNVWEKLERLNGFKLLEEGKIDGKVVSKEFEFPRSFVRFGKRGIIIASPKTAKSMSETQKRAMLEGRLRLKSHCSTIALPTSEPIQRGVCHQEARNH